MRQAPDALKVALYESGEQPSELYRAFWGLGCFVQRLPLNPKSWARADVGTLTPSSLCGRLMQQPRWRMCACSRWARTSCVAVEDGWQ